MNSTKQFKEFVRHPYAWPGGYPLRAVMADGECVCKTCAKDNAKLIIRATRDADRSDWDCAGVEVNWENADITCAHCGEPIEAAYA